MNPATDLCPNLSGILPWTRSCFVCGENNPHGLRLKSRVENGKVVIDYTPREADLGWSHIVHGGITATLQDEVMTWAAILTTRKPCVAAELVTRLRRPIAVGQPIRIEAWTTEKKGRLVTTAASVLDSQGELLASATGKYMPMATGDSRHYEKDFVCPPSALPLRDLMDLAP